MFIVVVTKNQRYDCLLTNQIFRDKEASQAAIEQAQSEDAQCGWEYDYTIVPIHPPVEDLTCERCEQNDAVVWANDTAVCYRCWRELLQQPQ